MVRRLRRVFGSSGDKDPSVVSLDRTKSNRDHEVDIQYFPLFPFVVDVVKSNNFLIELKEVDFIGSGCVNS